MPAGKLRSPLRKRRTKRLDGRRIRGEKRNLLPPIASLYRIQPFDGIRERGMRGKPIYRIRGDHRYAAGIQDRRGFVKGHIIAREYPHNPRTSLML